MYTTILLSVLLTLALSAVVVLCIKLHKHNSNFLWSFAIGVQVWSHIYKALIN